MCMCIWAMLLKLQEKRNLFGNVSMRSNCKLHAWHSACLHATTDLSMWEAYGNMLMQPLHFCQTLQNHSQCFFFFPSAHSNLHQLSSSDNPRHFPKPASISWQNFCEPEFDLHNREPMGHHWHFSSFISTCKQILQLQLHQDPAILEETGTTVSDIPSTYPKFGNSMGGNSVGLHTSSHLQMFDPKNDLCGFESDKLTIPWQNSTQWTVVSWTCWPPISEDGMMPRMIPTIVALKTIPISGCC